MLNMLKYKRICITFFIIKNALTAEDKAPCKVHDSGDHCVASFSDELRIFDFIESNLDLMSLLRLRTRIDTVLK